jgi:hypothetical protein
MKKKGLKMILGQLFDLPNYESSQKVYHRREREGGKFNRVIVLPKAEKALPRKITVKAR